MGLAMLLALAGCMSAPVSKTDDVVALRWGNEGSMFGAVSTVLTSDDRYVVIVRRGAEAARRTPLQGLDGTFVELVEQAAAALASMPAQSDVSACPDYGTDFVELLGRDGRIVARGEGLCPGSSVEPLLRDLSNRLRPVGTP